MIQRLFIALVLLATPASAQSWSNILSSSRAINWTGAGLPATLPDGETTPNPWTPPTRTQCGSTIAAGATPATINAAMAACATGTYVLLGAGTFNINADLTMFNQNGVTLRGSGGSATILTVTGTATIRFSIAWANGSCTWVSGFSVGTTSLTMNGCTGPALVAGEIVALQQCDDGFSGATCATGATVDNGADYVCGENVNCQLSGQPTGPQQHQAQKVYVNSVSGSGTITVNFTPGLYMPNWTSARSPTVNWVTSSSAGNTPSAYGNALEDLTVDASSNTSADAPIEFTLTYASWIKGVRILGFGSAATLRIGNDKSCLIFSNYIDTHIYPNGGPPQTPILQGSDSDDLLLNNIIVGGVIWDGTGGATGNVSAYNYGRDSQTDYVENSSFEHVAGASFQLYEANQLGKFNEDVTHGTHNLNTWFRNYTTGWDPPYVTCAANSCDAIGFNDFARLENVINNAFGGPYTTTNYESAGNNTIYNLGNGGFNDTLVKATMMRWGNCDTNTNTCRFVSAEVPTTLVGNAVPFQNTVPASHVMPCSFFLPTYTSTTCSAHPSGGTGLSWWKVCKTWTTFPTSCASTQIQPFPAVGSDVTGGAYVNGTAYDNPAGIAWFNLPIDPTYQNSYSITASSWAGGTETLTVTGLPPIHRLMGGFQITGLPACNTAAGAEFVMTASTATTVSYALGSNPGSCAGATMKFPDVRQFDERVFQSDPAGSPSAPCAVCFTALPLPPQSPIPVLTLSTPTQSYVTANGFSQDGKTWSKSLTLALTGTGFTPTTSCTFNGSSVPCVCGSATSCTATVPSSLVPIASTATKYSLAVANPTVPIPVIQ